MTSEASSHPGRRLACVVWTVPGSPIPDGLERVLRARGLDPAHLDSGFGVLAELCLAERRQDAPESGPKSILILAGGGNPERVLQAIERFAPSARVWIFEPSANPPLRAYVVSRVRDDASKSKLTSEDHRAVTRPRTNGVPVRPGSPTAEHVAERAGSMTELKLAGSTESPRLESRGREEPEPDGRPASKPDRSGAVSARDVLDDAELEMLLAGERGREDRSR